MRITTTLLFYFCALGALNASQTSIMMAGRDAPVEQPKKSNKPSANVPSCEAVLATYPGESKDYKDEYECVKGAQPLGKGTFGVAYQVRNKSTRSDVAMKVQVFVQEDEETRNLYIAQSDKEYRALRSMDHVNVIKVFGRKVFSGPKIPLAHAIFMELAHDGQLDKFLKEKREKWSIQTMLEIIDLFHQAVKGVMHIHEKGFLHRDLKPSNILVVGGKAKIIDLGLCMEEGDVDSAAGTYAYMDPVAQDPNDTTFAWGFHADAYSMGVTLHEIFYGSLLYPQYKGEQWEAAVNGESIEILKGTAKIVAELISGLTLVDCEKRMTLDQADDLLTEFFAAKNVVLLNNMSITSKAPIVIKQTDILREKSFPSSWSLLSKKEIASVQEMKMGEGSLQLQKVPRLYNLESKNLIERASKTSIELDSNTSIKLAKKASVKLPSQTSIKLADSGSFSFKIRI